jgi:uncharacterized protein involved in exopolysaccharide biosynthesis
MAKIEEAREDVAFQVVDRAVRPEQWVKPKRKLIVLLSGIAALFGGVFLAFLAEYVKTVEGVQTGRDRPRIPKRKEVRG